MVISMNVQPMKRGSSEIHVKNVRNELIKHMFDNIKKVIIDV